MTSRGGRDRFSRDYPLRSEEKSHHGRSNAPPSRHLWVGNLSHNLTERSLATHFLRFGELESVAFQPGRSYAFINYKSDEAAFEAMRALQGYIVAGNPLKIEFAKADKSSAPSRDEDYLQHRDEQRSMVRGSPFSHRDSRTFRSSPDFSYPDKPKTSDKNAEPPSEVLWIGFPTLLKVDEVILRRAFSPFGEIEKTTVFPGRSYAFVRFRNIVAACRAKETLQGKLFGNPRVHICFAKSESGSSNSGRNLFDPPRSPRFSSYGRAESFENFRQERDFGSLSGDPTMRSPRFISNLEPEDPNVMGFGRKRNSWAGMDGGFEQRRFQEPGPLLRVPENMYDRHNSPTRDGSDHFQDFSPHHFSRKGPSYDDAWDLPEDVSLHRGAKKLKVSSYPPEDELPEYPLSGSDQARHAYPRTYPDLPQPEVFDNNFVSGHPGYKGVPDHMMNSTQQFDERSERWNASFEKFQAGAGLLPPNSVDWKRSTPESHQPSLTEEWKWEGTIAKGGNPVCRARCFPVGKVLDMPLPEILDCTARTSLDMLAKHYYQAASSWVVFFVPGSDADIGFYNEFMHYMGEKQRAAVAKLDERTTLFLVPPSEFSEKVLKVPGKLSISGVILRLEHSGSNLGSSVHHPPHDQKDTNFMSYHGDISSPMPASHSGSLLSFPKVGNPSFLGSSAHGIGSLSDTTNENRNDRTPYQRNPTFAPHWSPHHLQDSNPGARNTLASSNAATDPNQGYNNAAIPRALLQETSSGAYVPGVSGVPQAGSSRLPHLETKPPGSSSVFPPEQLAQLTSSLLGQPRHSGAGPTLSRGEDFRQPSSMNHSENPYRNQQNYAVQNNNQMQQLESSRFGQAQQGQQLQPQPGQVQQLQLQPESSSVAAGSHQLQSGGPQEEDADPQKRLQATLQLAAALLQQIQQGKGT